MLATSVMDTSMKNKWFERWNSSHALREALKFPKPKFNDIDFPKWLHKATWWTLMIFLSFFIVHFNFYILS